MQSTLSAAAPGDVGPGVAALQDALKLLLESGVMRPLDRVNAEEAKELHELAKALAAERAASHYGEVTTALVLLVQLQGSLGDQRRGVADAVTVGVISQWMNELRPGDCGCGDSRPKSTPRRTDESWAEGVLSAEDAEALGSALLAAADAGVARESIDLIMGAISDLGALDQLAVEALTGATWLEDVAASVQDFGPWGRQLPTPRQLSPATVPALTLRSPGALPVAAYLSGALEPSLQQAGERARDADLQNSRKSVTAFLWRAEPVARLVFAARAWREAGLQVEQFVAVLADMSKILREPLDAKDLVAALRDSLTVLPFPSPIDPRHPLWPKRPPFSAWLLPENQTWAHCVLGLQRLFPPLPKIPEKAPPPGIIAPSTICLGSVPSAGLEVRLSTPAGGDFGLREPTPGSGEMWGLSVNGVAAEVISWTGTEIRFLATTVRAGCNKLSWTWTTSWSPDDNGVGAACLEALRIPPVRFQFGAGAWIANRTRFWTSPAQDLVAVGPTVGQLTASAGSGAAPAEACTAVTISWQVRGLDCQAAAALATTRLVRERMVQGAPEQVVLLADANPQGAITETLDTTATYRVEVTSQDAAGNSCGAAQATIVVTRQKRIRLIVPARVIAGQPATGRVTLSCPAPKGGQPISFTVAPSAALAVPSLTIPEGATSSSITLTAALCGGVSITATAQDHIAAPALTCALVAPTITSITPPADMRACTPFSIAVVAACVTQPPTLMAFAVAAAVRTPLGLTAPAGGTCGRSTTLTLSVPALEPGTYAIVLEDMGGIVTAPQSLTVVPNPRIVSLARSHDVFLTGSACPRPANTVTVTARGADMVDFAYAHPDGTITRTVTNPTAGCEGWQAAFSTVFDRAADVTVTPSFGATSGSAVSIPVNLSFGQGVASALDFFASDPAGTGVARALQIVRNETNPTTGTTNTTFETAIPNGATRRLALAPCVVTNFSFSRPAVDDPSSTSTPKTQIPAIAGNSGPWHGHPDASVERDQA